jgi:hypothetical protein
MPELRTRSMHVLAQDPGVTRDERILTARISVQWEDLQAGPVGHRVHVVDYDATTQTFYEPAAVEEGDFGPPESDAAILEEPGFHALNVYGLVMRTLGRFEFALGRRVSWGFGAHQLKVVPHAFEEMNAFYSREAQSLLFGYYPDPDPDRDRLTFMCLSHDIVVHETTHALLDGLRTRFMRPSSPDQAAFHEAFADIVALLSVFALEDVIEYLVGAHGEADRGRLAKEHATEDALKTSVLLGLADEMDAESGGARVNALRRSVLIEPDERILDEDRAEFREPHRRGEVLVAAMMGAFVDAWTRRLESLGTIQERYLDLGRVAEEGATIADVMLTMAIRALDYTPPIHLRFGDYLSAMITADAEVRSDDSRYGLRATLLDWFARYGISPASGTEDGLWKRPARPLVHEGVRLGSLQSAPDEVFRFVWTNRDALRLDPTAFTRVASVRPCIRTSPDDGMPVRETVAECIQYVRIPASQLHEYGLEIPPGMSPDEDVPLEGGSTLILDEYGRLKYEIHNRLPSADRPSGQPTAQKRLAYLWTHGAFDRGASLGARLATLHRVRSGDRVLDRDEEW